MNQQQAQNINHLWTYLIVEELVRNGIDYFCLSPGSRSAPLVYGVAKNIKAKEFIHFDERGMAFHALGYAAATGKPAVIITTSGTAVANLFPAVIEASKKKLPLIILTADRPPELRNTGANQTIDQNKIFGDYVRFYFDVPCPTADMPLASVLTLVDQAVFRAKGELPGPVHLNCMFREPLAPENSKNNFNALLKPIDTWLHQKGPFTEYTKSESSLSRGALNKVTAALESIKHGIIAVGKLKTESEQDAVLKLAGKLKWPIFPDVTSGLRLSSRDPLVISYFDQILAASNITDKLQIDGVLHIGGRITSKRYSDFIERIKPSQYVMLLNHPLRNDPLHTVSLRIQAPVAGTCAKLSARVKQRRAAKHVTELGHWNENVAAFLAHLDADENATLTEVNTTRLISKNIQADTGLFLASSLPVREMDMFAATGTSPVVVGGNRGASGIDGTIASAAGFAVGLQKPVTLLIGDLAFLHDINSLAILKNVSQPLVIVVFNNQGGGIFSFLPIAEHKDVFEKYFSTPHQLNFSAAADMHDIAYAAPQTANEFAAAYRTAQQAEGPTIIEVAVSRDETLRQHRDIQNQIQKLMTGKRKRTKRSS